MRAHQPQRALLCSRVECTFSIASRCHHPAHIAMLSALSSARGGVTLFNSIALTPPGFCAATKRDACSETASAPVLGPGGVTVFSSIALIHLTVSGLWQATCRSATSRATARAACSSVRGSTGVKSTAAKTLRCPSPCGRSTAGAESSAENGLRH